MQEERKCSNCIMFHDCTTKGAVCMFYVRMKREAIEQDKLDKMIKESE